MNLSRLRVFLPLLLLVPLQSCFTTAVWGGSVEDETDGSRFSLTGGVPVSRNVWVKLLLTPFAVVLDACTAPVQAVMFGWDDDEVDCRSTPG